MQNQQHPPKTLKAIGLGNLCFATSRQQQGYWYPFNVVRSHGRSSVPKPYPYRHQGWISVSWCLVRQTHGKTTHGKAKTKHTLVKQRSKATLSRVKLSWLGLRYAAARTCTCKRKQHSRKAKKGQATPKQSHAKRTTNLSLQKRGKLKLSWGTLDKRYAKLEANQFRRTKQQQQHRQIKMYQIEHQ